MAIPRCGHCSIPLLRDETLKPRCPACGALLPPHAATARVAAPAAPEPEDPGPLRRGIVVAVLTPLALAAVLYFAFRSRAEAADGATRDRDARPETVASGGGR
jgi:hypothetical protein